MLIFLKKNLKNKCDGFITAGIEPAQFPRQGSELPIFEVTITVCFKILKLVAGVEPTKSTFIPHQHNLHGFLLSTVTSISHTKFTTALTHWVVIPAEFLSVSTLKLPRQELNPRIRSILLLHHDKGPASLKNPSLGYQACIFYFY